jgi:hypothetical protein
MVCVDRHSDLLPGATCREAEDWIGRLATRAHKGKRDAYECKAEGRPRSSQQPAPESDLVGEEAINVLQITGMKFVRPGH